MSNERLIAAVNQLKRLLLDNKLLVVAVVCTTAYLGILDNVLESETMKLDEAAYWLIVENLRQPWLTPIMESFSNLATPVTIAVLWVLVTAFAPGRRVGLCTGVNLKAFVLLKPAVSVFRLAIQWLLWHFLAYLFGSYGAMKKTRCAVRSSLLPSA